LRELEFWSQGERDPERREALVRDSWNLYRTNGPMYRFTVPFPSGHVVSGAARRLNVFFRVPHRLPLEHREQLLAFLRSLRMGEPKLEPEDKEPEPPGHDAG